MPVFLGAAAPKISRLVVDADLDLASYKLVTSAIWAKTNPLNVRSAGGLLQLNTSGSESQSIAISGNLYATGAIRKDGTNPVVFTDGVQTDHLKENTGSHGIVTDHQLITDAGAKITAGQKLLVDEIEEVTGSAGVKVNDVLKVDHIAEVTTDHKVVVDDILSLAAGGEMAGSPLTGSNVVGCRPGIVYGAGSSYEVLTQPLYVLKSGTYNIEFQYRSGNGSDTIYAKIYVNGAAVGTERSTASSSWQTANEDIALSAGDYVEIWGKDLTATPSVTQVMMFALKSDVSALDWVL